MSPFHERTSTSTNTTQTAMAAAEKPCVLVRRIMAPHLLDRLRRSNYTVFHLTLTDDEQAFLAQNSLKVRAIVTYSGARVPAELVDALPNLEIVALLSVGTDGVALDRCRERGIAVTNTGSAVTEDTADLAMALVLASMRRLSAADRYVRQGLWPLKGHFPLAHRVNGKRFGIVGLGQIGQAIAKRAEGFGCKISYSSRSRKPECAYQFYDNIVDLAQNSDIVVLACALTKETTHIVNIDVLNALGPDGTLVNIARGSIIDEPELVKALIEGRLGAAGLDVFENEPHVPKELLALDNVVLTPHHGTATVEGRRDVTDIVMSNLEAHFSGKPLLTPVL